MYIGIHDTLYIEENIFYSDNESILGNIKVDIWVAESRKSRKSRK